MRATAILMSAFFLVTPFSTMAKQTAAKRPPLLTGTYVLKGRGGSGGTLLVRQVSPNKIEFDLECNRGAPSYNSGVAHAIIEVLDGIAVYRVAEFNGPCEINFDFKGAMVAVSQKGDDFACGFGHGVSCGGNYRLKSRKPPKFPHRD